MPSENRTWASFPGTKCAQSHTRTLRHRSHLVPGHRARVLYLPSTNVNTPFSQVSSLEFGHDADTWVQGRGLALAHSSGQRVPVCTPVLLVLGQSTTLSSLLSSCFKIAFDRVKWSNYIWTHSTYRVVKMWTQHHSVCASTQALVFGYQVWTAT